MRRTLKKLVMDRQGEKTVLVFYRGLGFSEKRISVENPMLKGIRPLNNLIRIPIFKVDTGTTSFFGLFNGKGIV